LACALGWCLGLSVAGWCTLRLLTEAWARARSATGTSAFGDLVTAAAQLALSVAVTWLLLALTACVLAEAPHRWARVADRMAGAMTPRHVRILVRLACGIAVTGPLGTVPVAAPATAGEPPTSCESSSCPTLAGLPLPDRPDAPAVGAAARDVPTPTAASTVSSRGAVVVRPGDSLWSLAAAHLPGDAGTAQIAAAWPQWFEVNRDVLGDDPDLIHPGTRLRVPRPPRSDRP